MSIDLDTLEADITNELAGRVSTRRMALGELVTLPFTYSTGNLVQVLVSRISDGEWLITDRGRTAGQLAMAGVDLDKRNAAAQSWQAIVGSMHAQPPILTEVAKFDLAASSGAGGLASAILEVGRTAVHAEMLKVLAPGFRAGSFGQMVLARVASRELSVVPDAPMPTRHGGVRRVTGRIQARQGIFIQAVSAKATANESYDKAQSIFTSAEVANEALVAVMARDVKLSSWQIETLEENGTTLDERDLDDYLDGLAA